MNQSEALKILLVKIAEDNEEAFTKLFGIFFEKVFKYTGYYLKTDSIRQEITSDVFLTIWNNRKKLSNINNIESYLFILTKNKSLDHLDKMARLPEFTNDLTLEISSEFGSPETTLLKTELEEVINMAVKDLPERCQLVYLLSKEEGYTHSKIAQMLSISEFTVNAQMVIALKKMGLAIRKYLGMLL